MRFAVKRTDTGYDVYRFGENILHIPDSNVEKFMGNLLNQVMNDDFMAKALGFEKK